MLYSPIPLQRILAWPGCQALQANFENKGYAVHLLHQSNVENLCDCSEYYKSFHQYQNELAMEVISSQGLSNYRGVYRKKSSFYNSAFIDELEREVGANFKEGRKRLCLHPCFSKYKKFLEDFFQPQSEYYSKYTIERQKLKQEEFDKKNLSFNNWDDTYKSLDHVFSEVANTLQFEKGREKTCYLSNIGSTWFYRYSASGIKFNVGYLKAGRGKLLGRLPLVFWVDFEKFVPSTCPELLLQFVLPGIEDYEVYGAYYINGYPRNYVEMQKRDAILGVWALMDAYNVLIDTM